MARESRSRQRPAAPSPIIDWPDETRSQVDRLVEELRRLLAENLVGVYLHGSLAMGCFNARTSDIDLLAVTEQVIAAGTKASLIELLLSLSGSPHPIEMSFLQRRAIWPWQFPTPFDLHYSETWRVQHEETLARADALPAPDFVPSADAQQTDTDLAAHIGVTRERGVVLTGEPIEAVFPVVPERDLRASLLSDLRWARGRLDTDEGLRYAVLNACRACAFLRERRIYSKSEGAQWALATLPREYHAAIEAALEAYRSTATSTRRIGRESAERLANQVIAEALREGVGIDASSAMIGRAKGKGRGVADHESRLPHRTDR